MTSLAKSYANLADFTADELRQELAKALEITADNLVWLARLWKELENRGEDLRELRTGLRTFLPQIADGSLDAQAAVQFAGNLTMLRALATMPIKEQRRLASGSRVPVVTIRGDKLVTRHMTADELSAKTIRQVFTGGRQRSESEQRAIIATITPPTKPARRPKERVAIDSAKLTVWRRLADRRGLTLEELLGEAVQPILDEEQARDQALRNSLQD